MDRSNRQYDPAAFAFYDQGNCRGEDPNLFIPADYEPNAERLKRESAAKAICALCKVVPECLEFGIRRREEGIWGGTNDNERKIIAKQRHYQAALASRSAS